MSQIAPSGVSRMEVNVEVLRHASIMALLGLLVSVTPLVMGVIFAIRPNEQRLALMRPLSLAGIFAGVSNLFLGAINGLLGLERVQSSIRPACAGSLSCWQNPPSRPSSPLPA